MRRTTHFIAGLVRGSLWLAGLLLVVAVAALVAGIYLAEARAPADVFDGTTAPGSHEWWKVSQKNYYADTSVPPDGLLEEVSFSKTDTLNNFCFKCHAKIKTELDASIAPNPDPAVPSDSAHKFYGGSSASAGVNCLWCHAANRRYRVSGVTGVFPTYYDGIQPRAEGAHVASVSKCTDCHYNQGQEFMSENEVHSDFLTQLGETDGLVEVGTDPAGNPIMRFAGDNVPSWACKACHTKVDINLTVESFRPALALELGDPAWPLPTPTPP